MTATAEVDGKKQRWDGHKNEWVDQNQKPAAEVASKVELDEMCTISDLHHEFMRELMEENRALRGELAAMLGIHPQMQETPA